MFQGPDFEGAAGRDTRSLAGGGEAYWAVPWRWILPAGDPLSRRVRRRTSTLLAW